jgi:hypothetical protein
MRPTGALIIQCIGTQYSPTCSGTLKCNHQGVKHDPAEIGAQCRGKLKNWSALECPVLVIYMYSIVLIIFQYVC